MPQIAAAANPELARKLLAEVDLQQRRRPEEPPPRPEPVSDLVFQLCGGYTVPGSPEPWIKDFEVRELTGRDEEYLGRIKDSGRFILGLLARGLVRVGRVPADEDVLDGLLGGDWETILLAIRIATFGEEVEVEIACQSCSEKYSAVINLRDNVEYRRAEQEDVLFDVKGRRSSYKVTQAFGAAQRNVFKHLDSPIAEMNTVLLSECVLEIGGRPVLGVEDARGIPMADRRKILKEIDARRVGPDLQGVRTKCPTCDYEQPSPLNVVGLFQG